MRRGDRGPRRAAALAASAGILLLGLAVPRPGTAGAPPPGALPRFALFGWLSPPADSTTGERLDEMSALGFDVLLPPESDPGTFAANHARMELAAVRGMRCLVFDARLMHAVALGIETPAAAALLDSIVADYRAHPGFLGWYLGDEPSPPWGPLARVHEALRARDPEHPTWNNLLGPAAFADDSSWRAYVAGYRDSLPVSVLCDDHYEFTSGGDRGQFFANAAGLSALARERVLPFWAVVQLVEHRGYRALTAGELRWQCSNLLAYGARGIGVFTYWTPPPDSAWDWQPAVIARDGSRTAWYPALAEFNARLRPAGERVAALRPVSVQLTAPLAPGGAAFAGDDWVAAIDGRATLGRFVDDSGVPHLVLVNRDSLERRTLALELRGVAGATRLDRPGGGEPVPLAGPAGARRATLELAAGDFALLRLEGTERGDGAVRLGPDVAVIAAPARGAVRFSLVRVGAAGSIAVVDALGRRVWSRPLAAGEPAATWDGARDRGGAATAGIYFVRVADHRGSVSRRFAWLGP